MWLIVSHMEKADYIIMMHKVLAPEGTSLNFFCAKTEYFTEDLKRQSSYYNETIEIGQPTSAEFLAFCLPGRC